MVFRIKRLLLGLVATIIMFSCSENKSLLHEIDTLKKEKDSLSMVLKEIENKYVFDSIFLKTIPSHKNTFRLNSDYEMDIILVAYGSNLNYFVGYDSIVNNKKVNQKILTHKNGTFKFKTKLNEYKNPISIDVNVDNKYGKSIKGTLSDVIKAK
jgi:hypothetical protein